MILDALLGRSKRASDSWFPAGADAVAGGPSSNFWYSLLMRPTKSGVAVNEESALTYSAVWCATMRRVGTMAQLPKNLYRRTGDRNREVARDRKEHWLLHERPNPELTAAAYHTLVEEWRLNGGNGYAEIQWELNLQTGKRTAVALWPIHPSRGKIVRNDAGDVFLEVKNKDAEPTYIPYASVINLPSLITPDGFRGVGVIRNARESIGLGLATEQHGADMLGGGGVPVVALEQDVAVVKDTTQRDAFRKEWKEIHGQGSNVPAILPPGMKIKTLTLSMEDLQFLSLRQHNVEEMSRWYDLPPHTLHHLLRATFSNIEHSAIEMVQYSFLPWIVQNEQEYLWKLFPDEEERRNYYFKWEVNGLLRGDSASRSAYYHNAINDSWMCPNDVREFEDMNPFDGGDTHFIQGAMTPVQVAANPSQETTDMVAADEQPTDSTELRRAATELTAVREELRATARGIFVAALSKMVHKEATAARRAAGKPSEFLRWLDDFYGDHESTLAEALSPVVLACVPFGMANEPSRWSKAICEQSRTRLLGIAGEATADSLAGLVAALMDEWEKDRAECIVRGIAELN